MYILKHFNLLILESTKNVDTSLVLRVQNDTMSAFINTEGPEVKTHLHADVFIPKAVLT